jgi:hypothetical protein
VAAHEDVGQAQFAAQRAHFVLEQFAQRSTSFMFMRSGRPPTLWWLLIVTEGPPVNDTLSITSG